MTSQFTNALFARLARYASLLFLFLALPVLADSTAELFNSANKLYEQQKFSAAATEYEKLLQNSNVSATVYFNLGNAYFKSGQIGRAIAAYRNAQELSPRDPEIRANLQFARTEAGSKVSDNLWQEWIHRFTVNGWTIATTTCFWIVFALLIAAQWRREMKKSLHLWAGVFGTLTVFLGVCLAFAAHDRFFIQPAVVAAQEAVIRRGPFDESQSYFTVRDGTELLVLDRKDKWVEITDRTGRIGWLPESQLVVLNGGR